MDYLASIQLGLDKKKSKLDIARKLFLTHPTSAFNGFEEKQFEILDEISNYFKVPITNVHVVGSSKIGESLHKRKKFSPGSSDLDIAIVDANLFVYYTEQIYANTKGFTDRTRFSIGAFKEYSDYVLKGIFRSDLMPSCRLRLEWMQFFGTLSGKHSDLFKSVNAAIYLSQRYFEVKQASTISTYIKLRDGGL